MTEKIFNFFKRYWVSFLLIAVVMLFIDWAVFVLALVPLSLVVLVVVFFDITFDRRDNWGLLPKFNVEDYLESAKQHPIASAMVWLGYVALIITVLLMVRIGKADAATIPAAAHEHLPTLSKVIDKHWPSAPMPEIMAGQVEQESSWKTKATLKTSRELGRGLVQLTIAYDSKGKERFNSYLDAVSYSALKDWNWKVDPYNPERQLTYLVLRDRSAFGQRKLMMVDAEQTWRVCLVDYNAGPGRVNTRRINARMMGLPQNTWTGGLEHAYGKGEHRLLYGRPLWQAVNEYPNVIFKRAAKYQGRV